jgi:hypothetical protein
MRIGAWIAETLVDDRREFRCSYKLICLGAVSAHDARNKAGGREFPSLTGYTINQHVGPDPVRSLTGMVQGRAKIGVFVCFKATDAMMRVVADAEPLVSIHGRYPSVQLLTVTEILAGKRPLCPDVYVSKTHDQHPPFQPDLKAREQPIPLRVRTRAERKSFATFRDRSLR